MMESTYNRDQLLDHLYVRLNQIINPFNDVSLVGFVLFLFFHCEIMIWQLKQIYLKKKLSQKLHIYSKYTISYFPLVNVLPLLIIMENERISRKHINLWIKCEEKIGGFGDDGGLWVLYMEERSPPSPRPLPKLPCSLIFRYTFEIHKYFSHKI